MPDRIAPEELRSARWFAPDDLRSMGHRSRANQMGYSHEDYAEKPFIGIINTWSDLNPCHVHFRTRAEEVKRGVWQQGGFPVEIPALALPEVLMKPSTMLYRNLLAMEVEEILRSHPIDGVVLMGGCDKTTPGLIMGATSLDLPAVYLPAGPMLPGNWNGQRLGSGTDVWRYWADRRAGLIGECEWRQIEGGISSSAGTCMTMGTASTMTSATEALGLTLPGAASIPAVSAEHARMATAAGRAAVELVWQDRRLSCFLTREAFEDAITTVMALGGSTNAVIHLIAMARRAGVPLDLDPFDAISRRVPVLANLRPSGSYLMEDFHVAGGVPAMLSQLTDQLHLGRPTVNGRTLGENLEGAEVHDTDVIRSVGTALSAEGGLGILHGNLAPDGAVIKHTAADPENLQHIGPALVFDSYEQMDAAMRDDTLEVDTSTVLVLRNAGPLGGPGMPEWGMLPVPDKLLRQGVRDMVRISDARMSGTSYGTCVLHVSPESFVGGPLALVEDGDRIELDFANRRLQLLVSDDELERRRVAWRAPEPRYTRGYGALFSRHIGQADTGCDFDFLEAGDRTPEPEIH